MAAAPVASFAADPLKVAFVYLGPRTDGGWTQQHDMARLALEKAMGDKIKTTFVENVPETADSERVFRQLAADGNKLIFATSFGYMEPLQKVAKLFPDVKFEHVNGFKT
ncbi:BMP family ABC transporter substrate-binding protein, partial [Bradyrhizobium sp.]|uniref:BMP family ABC transporter substrate-binding protein n=1 Tax=Bradyrhizobium sp. TaxID=376 RepID=UPI003C4F1828